MKLYSKEDFNLSNIFKGIYIKLGFPGGASSKESTCQCRRLRDVGLIPGLGRSPGVGNGTSLQYSCLENSMGRGAWRVII